MGFICISLMINDVEQLFMYLLDLCISSLEKYLCKVLCPFLPIIDLFFMFMLSLWVLYIFWMLTPCWKYDLQISSSFCWLFPFQFRSLWINAVPFIFFCFCFPCLWNQEQKTSLRLVSRSLVLDFCRGFIVSSMSFKL